MCKRIWFVCLVIVFSAVLGCDMGALRLTVQFEATEGLKVDDPVLFEENRVGVVKDVRYTTQGTYLVDILVDPEFKNALTVDSIFYIDNATPSGSKALIVEQPQKGGTLLPNRALVMGTQKPSPWRQMLDTLQKKSGEWEKQLDRQLDELGRSYEDKSAEADRDMDKAIAELNRQLRELQEAMRRAASSEEVKTLRRSAEELMAELQQHLAELGAQQPSAEPNAGTKQPPSAEKP